MADPITTRPVGGAASAPVPVPATATRPQARTPAVARTDAAGPGLPDARAAKSIASVRSAGVALAAPGKAGTVDAPTTPAPAQGAPSASVASIIGIVDLIVANEDKIKKLGEVADATGNVLSRIGDKTLAVAKDGAGLTKRLWSGSWLSKIGAVFTAIGTGLLFAIGGILAGTGWVLHTAGGALAGAFGTGTGTGNTPPPKDQKKELEQKNDELRRQLVAELERLRAETPARQRAALQELVHRAGDGERGKVVLEACTEAELDPQT